MRHRIPPPPPAGGPTPHLPLDDSRMPFHFGRCHSTLRRLKMCFLCCKLSVDLCTMHFALYFPTSLLGTVFDIVRKPSVRPETCKSFPPVKKKEWDSRGGGCRVGEQGQCKVKTLAGEDPHLFWLPWFDKKNKLPLLKYLLSEIPRCIRWVESSSLVHNHQNPFPHVAKVNMLTCFSAYESDLCEEVWVLSHTHAPSPSARAM